MAMQTVASVIGAGVANVRNRQASPTALVFGLESQAVVVYTQLAGRRFC
jgi:hypothetical protein